MAWKWLSTLLDMAAGSPDVGERWRARGWVEHPPVIVAAPMDDGQRALTSEQLAALAANYVPSRDVAAVVANLAGIWPDGAPGLSHGPAASQPPLGFVAGLYWEPPFLWASMWGLPGDEEGEPDKLTSAIKAGYVRRSIRLTYLRDPLVDGQMEHVCLLGGEPPGVSGMPLLEAFAGQGRTTKDYVFPGAEPGQEEQNMNEEQLKALLAEAMAPLIARIGALEAACATEQPADAAMDAAAIEDRVAARIAEDFARREADNATRIDLTARLQAAVAAGTILPAVAAPLREALAAAGPLAPTVINLARAQIDAARPVIPGPIEIKGTGAERRAAILAQASQPLSAGGAA